MSACLDTQRILSHCVTAKCAMTLCQDLGCDACLPERARDTSLAALPGRHASPRRSLTWSNQKGLGTRCESYSMGTLT